MKKPDTYNGVAIVNTPDTWHELPFVEPDGCKRCVDGWIPFGHVAKACDCNHSVFGVERIQNDPWFVKMIAAAAAWPEGAK